MKVTIVIVEISVVHPEDASEDVQTRREQLVLNRLFRDPRILNAKRIDQDSGVPHTQVTRNFPKDQS